MTVVVEIPLFISFISGFDALYLLDMALNCILRWGSSSGALGSIG